MNQLVPIIADHVAALIAAVGKRASYPSLNSSPRGSGIRADDLITFGSRSDTIFQ
jgi:hypothetical protein